jgi:bifunctional enzyme CysN/CysC
MPGAPLKLVVAGHVDHGKSTLVGRLLHDTGSLLDGRLEELKAAAARRGIPFEWSFALDAMQAERDQAVTIETTRIWLRLPGRDALIIDAPGHREFLAKMITGAAAADAALLILDAVEGVQDQTRRHVHLLRLLGIAPVIVAVNKMDLVGFDEAVFRAREREIAACLAGAGLEASAIVPVVAPDGDNLAKSSTRMGWYDGPTVAAILAGLAASDPPINQPLRLPIQDIYRIEQRRFYVGRIESGQIKVGDEVVFSPSNKVARVETIELWPAQLHEAAAGQSIAITLDRPLFAERGELVSHVADAPLVNRRFGATLVWLADAALRVGQTLRMQVGTAETVVTVEAIERVIDTGHSTGRPDGSLARDEIGDVVLRTARLLAIDDAGRLPRTGRFVLRARGELVAGGLIRLAGIPDLRPAAASAAITPVSHRVTRELRAERFGHRGGVLWLTGLSGSGKSTLAMAAEEHLFRKGYAVYVLDGDNVRSGLNADLGFSPEARVENIRRIGELAALFADAGFICITAFISPFAADRARARVAAGAAFHEIHVSTDLATCEQRDPKGLYRRARAGEIREFTGVSAAYEPPEMADLVLDTAGQTVEASVERLLGYVERHFAVGVVNC